MKVYEGNIISCDNKNSTYRYLAEENGIIKFLGDVLPEKYSGADKFYLGEKALLPSFADTHLHFSSYSLFSSTLDVRSARNFTELKDMINSYSKNLKEDFILAFGVSAHNVEEKHLISREELDEIYSEKPLMIIKYDGHASVNNSKMLALLPDYITKLRGFHKESGQLNQEAYFAATDFMTKKISSISIVKNMLKGIDSMAENGIGMMHTVEGVGFPRDLDVDMSRFFAKGQRNPFQIRIFFQTLDINKVIKRKLPRIGGCFASALDGCFGSMDAALIQPYRNTNNNGVLFYSDEKVTQFAKEANRKDLQIEVHAIGDAAFDQAVNALEAALKDHPRNDHRHTIIHSCLPTKRGLEKAAKLDIGIAAQPAFLQWPLEPLSYIEDILGDRAYKISPFRTMLDMGLHVSGGSDAPCTIPDPIEGIYSACNHYVEDESVTIQEALRMFTYEAARMSFDEKERGSLEEGKIADLVIFNKNPLKMKKEDLRQLKSEGLILSGKPYKPNQSLSSLIFRGAISMGKKI